MPAFTREASSSRSEDGSTCDERPVNDRSNPDIRNGASSRGESSAAAGKAAQPTERTSNVPTTNKEKTSNAQTNHRESEYERTKRMNIEENRKTLAAIFGENDRDLLWDKEKMVKKGSKKKYGT